MLSPIEVTRCNCKLFNIITLYLIIILLLFMARSRVIIISLGWMLNSLILLLIWMGPKAVIGTWVSLRYRILFMNCLVLSKDVESVSCLLILEVTVIFHCGLLLDHSFVLMLVEPGTRWGCSSSVTHQKLVLFGNSSLVAHFALMALLYLNGRAWVRISILLGFISRNSLIVEQFLWRITINSSLMSDFLLVNRF